MASILRSSKFVRYIAGFAKNIVVNTPREFDGSLINTTQCICGVLPRNFATQTSSLTEQNLESSLRRIDQDVRKSGRISRRDIEDVLEEIRNARSATSSQSLLVIRCCGNLVPEELPETRTKLVQEIWNTLNKLNIPMDISHYNALLRVYLENEHSFSPTEFLSELESKGIEPNRVTYQRLIAKYCQDGDIEGATKILEYMREKQIAVNENVFNALIIGHSKSGDMDSAQGIINVMTQAGLEPSADTYTTLLCGYANKGDIESIMRIIDDCETREVFLLDKDYLDIIFALGINRHVDHIPAILNKVRRAIGYNQDAINVILRLINKGHEDAAFLVLKSMSRTTREDGTLNPSGHFFIKQLIKANRPLGKIIEICTSLEKEGMYEKPLILAAETSLQLGNEQLAYPLLDNLKDQGINIRQHFFWPLIVAKAEDRTGQEITGVLRKMQEYDLVPNSETLREYVIPNLKGNSIEILALLREGNISVGSAASSLVVSLLHKYEIEEAAAIATRVQAFYKPDFIRRPLSNSFFKTGDYKSYISILRSVYENVDRRASASSNEADQEEESPDTTNKSELIGSFVLDLATNQRKFAESINKVLEELVKQGLSISSRAAERIEEKLGEKMTDEISSLLGKLTSGELTPVPLQRRPPSYVPSHQMNIPQLEKLIENLTLKNQDTNGLKRQLFNLYYRAKNLENTERLYKELEQSQFTFSSGIYAQLLDLYAYHDNVDKAMEFYGKLKETEKEDFTLDDMKIIRLAHVLAKNDRLDESISILEDTPRDKIQEERMFSYSALIWRFLNSFAEKGQVDELNRVFDILLKKEYIIANNVLLGPLIKVHIVREELDKALEKFEWCVNQYKVTPWKNDLACHLIQQEDAEKLQKLTDLSTNVHGEVNSLYDLVFAFVECGRIRQARKILETPGLQNRPQRITSVCERYRQEGLVKPLEGLKDATKDLNHIDRSEIYQQLLLSYIKQEDADKALGLWTQMQEEDLAPTDNFLSTLGEFLQRNNLEVPFVIPGVISNKPKEPVKEQATLQPTFRQKLKAGSIDEALELKNKTKDSISTSDLCQLIEKLLQNGRLKEASQFCLEILNRGNLPVNRVFRFLLNKLASSGDVETLTLFGSKISKDAKKLVSFDNRICHAYLVANKAKEYLDKLGKDIEEAETDKVALLSEEFPRGGAYGILEKCPELTEQYESVALKYAEKGVLGPLNVFWTHCFICGNDEKAEQIWTEHLKDSPRIMFQKIVHTARDNGDENLAKKLIEHLKISNVTEGAIGNAYSCLLDVLVSKEKHADVVEVFTKAVNEISLSQINRTAIMRAKESFEKLSKPFEYAIPPRTTKHANTQYNAEELM